jgi:hypothetical protein
MAEDIVGGLFGVNPAMYQQEQQQQVFNRAVALQNLNPLQQASVGLQQAGYNFAGALGGAMGGVDPQLQRISTLNAISKQIDQSNPKSMMRGAKLLADAGFQQEALGLAQYARKASTELATAAKSQAEVKKLEYAQMMDEKLRTALGDLGEDATESDVIRTVAQYGNPDKVLAVVQNSQDKVAARQQVMDVAKTNGEAKVEAAKIAGEARIDAAKLAADAKLEAARERGESSAIIAQMRVDSNNQIAQLQIDSRNSIAAAQNESKVQLANIQASLGAGQRELKTQLLQLQIENARNKNTNNPMATSLQRDEIKDLETIDGLKTQVDSLAPTLNSLKADPKTGKAPLELGPINNLKYQASNAAGNSTTESRAYAELQRAVQSAVNIRTSAEKGVQTDNDVLRFARELEAAFGRNDTKTTLEALRNFSKAAEKAQENTLRKIEQRRASAGAPAFAPIGATPEVGTTKAAPAVVPTKRWNSQTNQLEEVK